MDKFNARENFRRLTNRFGFEFDPRTRACLEKLLLKEEDRLGINLELIAEVRKAAFARAASNLVGGLSHQGFLPRTNGSDAAARLVPRRGCGRRLCHPVAHGGVRR